MSKTPQRLQEKKEKDLIQRGNIPRPACNGRRPWERGLRPQNPFKKKAFEKTGHDWTKGGSFGVTNPSRGGKKNPQRGADVSQGGRRLQKGHCPGPKVRRRRTVEQGRLNFSRMGRPIPPAKGKCERQKGKKEASFNTRLKSRKKVALQRGKSLAARRPRYNQEKEKYHEQ